MSQAPVRAEHYGPHGKAFAEAMVELNRQTDEGVSWSGNERNVAFLNLGSRSDTSTPDFADISALSGFDFPDDARALSTIDWDYDGDVDVLTTSRTGPRFRLLRNTGKPAGRYVQFRLRGVDCNRQAIGSRVELQLQQPDGTTTTLMRTLYAGHGFLSQSSQWLHFGLGDTAEILKVVVRWPGGKRHQVSGITSSGQFVLTEGQATAERWSAPKSSHRLHASTNEPPPLENSVAVRLARPLPLPPLVLHDSSGNHVTLNPPAGPVLLNLWATWCVPCRNELAELERRADELKDVGLDVIAVNVEFLGQQSSEPRHAPEAVLSELGFSFRSAIADDALMDRLHLAHRVLFVRPTQLPLPTSLLIDERGRIAAIYRGTVSVNDLLHDVKALVDPSEKVWQTHSQLDPGRWLAQADPVYYVTIAKELIERNQVQDAAEFLISHAETLRQEKKYAGMLMLCGTKLLQSGRFEQSTKLLEQAVLLRPDDIVSRNNLAIALIRQQKWNAAREHLQKAVAVDPSYIDAQMNLARIALQQADYMAALAPLDAVLSHSANEDAMLKKGIVLIRLERWLEAKEVHQQLLERSPDHVQAHVNLGGIHATLGELEAAVQHYETALQLAPERRALKSTIDKLRAE